MTPEQHVSYILNAYTTARVTVTYEPPTFRASMAGPTTVEVVTPCRKSVAEAIETLYDILVERAWKDIRPRESLLRHLGVDVEVTQRHRPGGEQ